MSKTYKGWEILKMTEEGKFKEGDRIASNVGESYYLYEEDGLYWMDEQGYEILNSELLSNVFTVYNKFYGCDKVEIEQLEVGYYAYSNYTHGYYIVATLPRMHNNDDVIYTLVRLEGNGYYYKSNSFEELQKKISMDGGETIIYKNIGTF